MGNKELWRAFSGKRFSSKQGICCLWERRKQAIRYSIPSQDNFETAKMSVSIEPRDTKKVLLTSEERKWLNSLSLHGLPLAGRPQ